MSETNPWAEFEKELWDLARRQVISEENRLRDLGLIEDDPVFEDDELLPLSQEISERLVKIIELPLDEAVRHYSMKEEIYQEQIDCLREFSKDPDTFDEIKVLTASAISVLNQGHHVCSTLKEFLFSQLTRIESYGLVEIYLAASRKVESYHNAHFILTPDAAAEDCGFHIRAEVLSKILTSLSQRPKDHPTPHQLSLDDASGSKERALVVRKNATRLIKTAEMLEGAKNIAMAALMNVLVWHAVFYSLACITGNSLARDLVMKEGNKKIIDVFHSRAADSVPVVGSIYNIGRDIAGIIEAYKDKKKQIQNLSVGMVQTRRYFKEYVRVLEIWRERHEQVLCTLRKALKLAGLDEMPNTTGKS